MDTKEKTSDQRQFNLGGADFLPEWKGCAAPPERSQSLSKARKDGVGGSGYFLVAECQGWQNV